MARKKRFFVQNSAQHILLKSLNNMNIFLDAQDNEKFITIINKLNEKYAIAIHAYIVKPTFFQFLATPQSADVIPRFMQSLGRNYVLYFNEKYNRTGTLWQGRYKASLIEDTHFLFDIMQHIEKKAEKEYIYSSLNKNLNNDTDEIITQHSFYKELGKTDKIRREKYANLFNTNLDENKEKFIVSCINRQLITGSELFIKRLENLTGENLLIQKRGRPKKQNTKQRKNMYKNLVVLDKQQHKELKMSPLENLFFAKEVTTIPLLATEVPSVGNAFPVVFSGTENPALVAIVALGNESFAVNEEGKWTTPYIPSHIRKYPFTLANSNDNPDKKIILIDESSPLLSKSKGRQLFKKSGDISEILSKTLNFLKTHEEQMEITLNVTKAIYDADILEEREISVGEGTDKKILVKGFKVVNRDKLNKLDDVILAEWSRKGILQMIDAHIQSLEKIQTLFDLAHQRQS